MRHTNRRGQAFLELALSLPLVVLLALGTSDLGRAFYVNLPVAGMASTGALVGATSNVADIGTALRQESNIVANTSTAWGNVYYDGSTHGANSDCYDAPTGGTTQSCGDPYGCPTSGTHNAFTSSSRVACFAVGMCTLDATTHNGQCSSAITWQSRPPSGAAATSPYTDAALVVKVVCIFTPLTPLVANLFSSTGRVLYLTQTEVIPEEY